jgi:hypothetical protein
MQLKENKYLIQIHNVDSIIVINILFQHTKQVTQVTEAGKTEETNKLKCDKGHNGENRFATDYIS